MVVALATLPGQTTPPPVNAKESPSFFTAVGASLQPSTLGIGRVTFTILKLATAISRQKEGGRERERERERGGRNVDAGI